MSVINKKPFIQSLIGSLTEEQLSTLSTLLNGASSTIFRSFINLSKPFTVSDKGISHCVFEAKDAVFTGYLIYNNTYCVLIAYNGKSQKLEILKIDYSNDKYEKVDEELSIDELRGILADYSSDASFDANVLDLVYPVGSIYVCASETMPTAIASLGTWTALNGGNAVKVPTAESAKVGTGQRHDGYGTTNLTWRNLSDGADYTPSADKVIGVITNGASVAFSTDSTLSIDKGVCPDNLYANLATIDLYMWQRTA